MVNVKCLRHPSTSTSPPDRNSSKQCRCNLTSLFVLNRKQKQCKGFEYERKPRNMTSVIKASDSGNQGPKNS